MANKKSRKAGRGDPSQVNQPLEQTIGDRELRRRIAEKAYERYERRGRIPGQEVEDWLEAERMVMAELNSERPTKPLPLRGRRIRSKPK